MSFVGSMLGFGGGGGASYKAQAAPVIQPTDTTQIGNAYLNANQGLNQQWNFVNSTGNQHGIGNEQNVFNQQQGLANQLQGVANGTGPNPALQQLQNTTGQNIAAQNALMAGQRGTSANAGLLARQAAMQGANLQQQAVGQGAALQAQQQLAAMQALQSQQAQMGSLAGAQVNQEANAIQGYNQAAQSEQGNLLGALGNYNNANVAMQSNLNSSNAGIAGNVANSQANILGGLMNGASAAAGALWNKANSGADSGSSGGSGGGSGPSLGVDLSGVKGSFQPNNGMAKGGMVRHYDMGGSVAPMADGPQSAAGRFLYGSAPSNNVTTSPLNPVAPASSSGGGGGGNGKNLLMAGAGALSAALLHGGASAGAATGAGDLLGEVAFASQGGTINGEALRKPVPGQAKMKGDSLKNDIVPAMLSPGEVVIPRHVMQSKDPVQGAAKFVASVLKKKGRTK